MRRAELVTAVLFAAFSVYVMVKSGQPAYEDGTWFANITYVRGEGPGSGFWSFYLAGLMLVCSIWIIVNWVLRTSPPSQSTEPFLDTYGKSMLLKVGGGVFMLIFLVNGLNSFGAVPFPNMPAHDNGYPVMSLNLLWEIPVGVIMKGGGVYLSMTLFLFYYIYFLGRHSMKLSLAISIGAPIATFFFFDVAMRITLPKGYIEPFFIPLYDAFL